MTQNKKSSFIIYYIEKTSQGFNLFEIDFDKRAKFWLEHPSAKEITKKEFHQFTDAAIEASHEVKTTTNK